MRKKAGGALAAAAVLGGFVAAPRAEASATVSGVIAVSSQLNATLLVAQTDGCNVTTHAGFDGWVLNPGAATRISVVGKQPEKVYDLNVMFLNRSCHMFRASTTPAADELNVAIPAGTYRVFVQLGLGAGVQFDARLS